MLPTLFTARTVLVPLALADAPQIQASFPQWEVVKYLNARVPWPYPADGAQTFVRQALAEMNAGTAWYWSIRPANDAQRIIGVANVTDETNANRGFWLVPQWQRRGLMSEVIVAITDYWFDVLERDVLRVYKAIENTGSRRLSEKSGMRVVDAFERDFVCGRLPAELWEISADEWRRYRRGRVEG